MVRRIELLGAIEKEWSLLGEEERCARIDDELSGIGFDLREVRMDGAVEGEVFGDSPAYIAADDGPLGGVRPVVARCRRAYRVLGDLGIDVEHEPAAKTGEAVDRSRLGEE